MNTSSNWTGRTPRTLVQAFGAYVSQHIDDDYVPLSLPSLAIAAIGVLFLAGIVLGVI